MEVIMSTSARKSLVAIGNFIEEHFGRMKSIEVVLSIKSFISLLANNPRLGRAVEEWSWRGEVRCAVFRQNKVYYLLRSDYIAVIVVWDCRQNPARLRQAIERFFDEDF